MAHNYQNGVQPKYFKLKIASQNIKGYTRADKDNDYIIDIINGMHRGGYHIALLQDTQHCYKPEYMAPDTNPQLNTHSEPGIFEQFFVDKNPTHMGDHSNMTQFWPYGAIWSDCDNTVRHPSGSAGVAIVLSNLAAKALETAIKTLGRDKCILQFGPRLLAIRLIFKDIKGKEVQFLVASAYAPPTGNTRYGERMDEFYANWSKLLDECTEKDILIIGGDLNAHVGTSLHKKGQHPQPECNAVGRYGLKQVNNAGKRIREYALEHNLVFANTFFRAPKSNVPAPVATWKNVFRVRNDGYLHTTYVQNKKCYQLDHFIMQQHHLKRVHYAYTARSDLLPSDHRTISMSIRVAKSLKKPKPMELPPDYSQIGMSPDENGELKPTPATLQFIHNTQAAFVNLNPGIHAHIDRRMRAATTAMKQAEQQLPRKKRHSVWFADISPQLTKLHAEVQKVERQRRRHDITGQKKNRLRSKLIYIRRQRQKEIKKCKENKFKNDEAKIDEAGHNGPTQTSGRREWEVRTEIRDIGQSRKKQTLQLNKLHDPTTGKEACTSQDRIRIIEDYTDQLYSTHGFDINIVDQIPSSEPMNEQLPTPAEIQEAMQKVKSRRARRDVRAELWKATLFNPAYCPDIKKVMYDMIIQQYQAYQSSDHMSKVSGKILAKSGKKKSGKMKDKRIIVIQSYCTCTMEILCRERLEEVLLNHVNTYLFQYGFTAKKGTQEALFVHRNYITQRRKLGLDTYILNLDVVKAFDKMTPQIIYKTLLRIGAPPTLVDAIKHLYATRILQFKVDDQTAQVPQSANRTLLMQGGALGPTIYKCLKLGIWLSLDKETVWPNQHIQVQNDFSHKLKGRCRGYNLENHYLIILLTIFADDMQLYFDTWQELQNGATAFINHLLKWGLKVHTSPAMNVKSKSKAMLCEGEKRIQIRNDGLVMSCSRPAGAKRPIQVPGGYIHFVDSYTSLGSIWTSDTKMIKEITNRKGKFLQKLHLYKDCLKSRSLSKSYRKMIIRVCLDPILFYSCESMILSRQDIKVYESARLSALRTLHNITRFDQHIYHINREKLLKIYSMAPALEKIMRRTITFITKIIKKSPQRSPERMLMGSPKLIWKKDELTIPLQYDTWNPGYAKTVAMYFEERAMQLYYHVKIRKSPTNLHDPEQIIRALLGFEGNEAFMSFADRRRGAPTWMELIMDSPALWERVVKYGQFQPIDPEETEQMMRQRRKNTFPKTVPNEIINEHGGRSAFIRTIREHVF